MTPIQIAALEAEITKHERALERRFTADELDAFRLGYLAGMIAGLEEAKQGIAKLGEAQ